jgi:hypothetical protein
MERVSAPKDFKKADLSHHFRVPPWTFLDGYQEEKSRTLPAYDWGVAAVIAGEVRLLTIDLTLLRKVR